MRRAGRLALLLLVLGALVQADPETPGPQRLPPGLRQALTNATSAQLYSLDPEGGRPGPLGPDPRVRLHRYPVVDQAALSGPEAQDLARALLQDIDARTDRMRTQCFFPRQALRISGFDLLVCFECAQVAVWSGESGSGGLLLSGSSQGPFRDLLLRHHLAWPGWLEISDGVWKHRSGIALKVPGNHGVSQELSNDALAILEQDPAPEIPRPAQEAARVREVVPLKYVQASGQLGFLELFFPEVRFSSAQEGHALVVEGPALQVWRARRQIACQDRPPRERWRLDLKVADYQQTVASFQGSGETEERLNGTLARRVEPSPPPGKEVFSGYLTDRVHCLSYHAEVPKTTSGVPIERILNSVRFSTP